MAVTYRDRAVIERGTIGEDGSLGSFEPVARNVRCFFWETLEKRIAVEGEIYVAQAGALFDPAVDIQRRDIVEIRERRFEIMDIFPGRTFRAVHKFNHAVLRESEA